MPQKESLSLRAQSCQPERPPQPPVRLLTRGQKGSKFGECNTVTFKDKILRTISTLMVTLLALTALADNENNRQQGYYRYPSLHKNQLVFTAEGDLWAVDRRGGLAGRLTSNPGQETHAAVSPDGRWLAFTGEYNGPKEVYLMPLTGGSPKRMTYSGGPALVRGWSSNNHIIFASDYQKPFSDQFQLFTLNINSKDIEPVPLAQASDGVFDRQKNLFFVRQPATVNYTRGYQGGTVENIWFYQAGKEAIPLTTDYTGTSKKPMLWDDRLYFVSDRADNRLLNLWSCDLKGQDLKQHSFESRFDIFNPSLSEGFIAYQAGADLVIHDLANDTRTVPEIRLASDFEQRRPKLLHNPVDFLTSYDISDDNQRLALAARGKLTTFPTDKGRIINIAPARPELLYQTVRFLPGSQDMIVIGEQGPYHSIWRIPAKTSEPGTELYKTETAVEAGPAISPDGQWLAWSNSEQKLFITNTSSGETKQFFHSPNTDYAPREFAWSPDSHWLVFVSEASNLNLQLNLLELDTGQIHELTNDRVSSFSPSWSETGSWLVFISNRYYESRVHHAFAHNQQEPFSTENSGIFAMAMDKTARWPYNPTNELDFENNEEPETSPPLTIDPDGISKRIYRFPLPKGRYQYAALGGQTLFWLEPTGDGQPNLKALAIHPDKVEPYSVAGDVAFYRISNDGAAIHLFKDNRMYLLPSHFSSGDLNEFLIDTSRWQININPETEWQQILTQAWKYFQNYFYDEKLNQVDWHARLSEFMPLVDRVTEREELNDVIRQMISAVGILHLKTNGGDSRHSQEWQNVSWLGASLENTGTGYSIKRIYRSDSNYPEESSPLNRPEVQIQEGDIIKAINGQSLESTTPTPLLLDQAGQQVLVEYQRPSEQETRKDIVYPISTGERRQLLYSDWLESNRQYTSDSSDGQIGYIHLQALSSDNFTQWVRQFYPVFQRQGLILDLRHNPGGNIDSWILSRLIRKAVYFQTMRNQTSKMWGMPYAFRGHIVALINEETASDAEVLAQSLRELKLAPLIGTRTWGGRVWKTDVSLVDHGFFAIPMEAHYNQNRQWASESYGLEPDILIDNLPHKTFMGNDAQLEKAVHYLLEKIKKEPVTVPSPPQTPVVPAK